MFIVFVFFILLANVNKSWAEVELKLGVPQSVTFEGPELQIKIDNSRGKEQDWFTICFNTTRNIVTPTCPKGYDHVGYTFGGHPQIQVMRLNRDGRVLVDKALLEVFTQLNFDENGVISVSVSRLPDPTWTTVTLLNAVVYVPKKEEEAPVVQAKETKTANTSIIVVCVLLVISGILVIGFLIWFCLCRKATPSKRTPEHDQENVAQTHRKASKKHHVSSKSMRSPGTPGTTPTSKQNPNYIVIGSIENTDNSVSHGQHINRT